jgi:hypothetical protein
MEAGKKAAGFVTDFDSLLQQLKAEGYPQKYQYSGKMRSWDNLIKIARILQKVARPELLEAIQWSKKRVRQGGFRRFVLSHRRSVFHAPTG